MPCKRSLPGVRSGTRGWNREVGRMESGRKESYKNTPVRAAPRFTCAGLPSSVGRRAGGWLWVASCWNPAGVSEGWSPLWGSRFLCWARSELFLHDIQVMLSRKEGAPSRKVLPGGMGRLRIPNPQVSPWPSGRRPSPLTMALFPSGSHLVCGRILWAWRGEGAGLTQSNCGKGQCEGWVSEASGSVWFSSKHGTSSIMVFKMSFALYKFMEKDCMLKSLKANFVLNTKVLL